MIVPAADGTGTIVTPDGNQINIGGGTQSGANLFQSFQQFGLSQNQIANFLSNPSISNILGRVVGGDPSVINGLIQVTGGNSNLFLMNPAGIVFGPNASLNVPGSFTATTANGIGIGNNWFSATGANDFARLSGNPNSFAFTTSQPGSIVNFGNLAVPGGQSLTLVGGSVINTGTLAAPGGAITILAVPGEKLVRLSQAGSVLSLDLPIDSKAALNSIGQPLQALSLPQLLTAGNVSGATAVVVENGVVRLTSNNQMIPTNSGTTVISGVVTTANEAGSGNGMGGMIQVLGQQVNLVSASLDASGPAGGGTVLIGGDYQGKGSVPNALQTSVSNDSSIRANALSSGNGGRVIVWADQTTNFAGKIDARGGVVAGNGGFA